MLPPPQLLSLLHWHLAKPLTTFGGHAKMRLQVRTYADVMREQQLARERDNTLRNIAGAAGRALMWRGDTPVCACWDALQQESVRC